MPTPRSTIWKLEPHTRAKHEILRRYLQAWMPILSQGNFPKILYIDGFAGPGRYTGGEDGSPIIALKAARAFQPRLRAQIHFLFVEKDIERAQFLQRIIRDMEIPSSFQIFVEGGVTFEEAFQKHRGKFERGNGKLIPTFAFLDPFGWTGAPMSIIRAILNNPSCEVLFNFMYEEINRFISHPDQGKNFDALFGAADWRDCINIVGPRKRRQCIWELYQRQLSSVAGAKFVRSFEMRNRRNQPDYYLFYGTNNIRGLEKMKDAMWAIDESGEFTFADLTDPNQLVLFGGEPNVSQLRAQLIKKFEGKEPSVEEIEYFVLAETAFKATHYKRVLRNLECEQSKILPLNPAPRRKPGTYADRTLKLRFSDK